MISILKKHINKIIVLADQAVLSGVNFINGILLCRLLGIDEFGEFVFIWMIALFFMSFNQSFLISSLLSLFPKKKKKEEFFNSLLILQVFSSISYFVFGFVVFQILRFTDVCHLNQMEILCGSGLCSLVNMHDLLRRFFLVSGREVRALFIDCITYLLLPLIALIFIFLFDYELSLLTILFIQLSLFGIGVLISFKLIIKSFTIFSKLSVLKSNLIEIWIYSRYLMYTSILQWFTGNFIIMSAGVVIGTYALGIIRIMQNTVGVMNILLQALENLIPSSAAKLLAVKGPKRMKKYLYSQFWYWLIPVATIIGLSIIFRDIIIEYLYGQEYVEYSYLLIYFALMNFLIYFGTILRFYIRTIEKNILIFKSYILTSIVSFISCKFLLENYNLLGVISGLIIIQFFSLGYFIFSLQLKKHHV